MSANLFSAKTATAIIVANMVGTGVFTSLGFQLLDLSDGFTLLSLWIFGGLAALCGAVSYAELGARMPRSGGEYHFISEIFHPAAGFVSGWVSASIGFAAPVALAAITFARYLGASFPQWLGTANKEAIAACFLILALTILHARSHQRSAVTQSVFTALKIAVIIGFCVAAMSFAPERQVMSFWPSSDSTHQMSSGAFAIALIYVSYAYTGWNAAAYLSSEIDDVQRSLPRALIAGTLIVTVLYVALNSVFLSVASADSMRGELEVGFIAAQAAFGQQGAQFTGVIMAGLLISTVSAMTVAGPRVLQVLGQDYRLFKPLAKLNQTGIPSTAIYCQSVLAIGFVVSASFDSILLFAGFTLALNSFVTVTGLLVLRSRKGIEPSGFSAPFYPLPQLIYLALTGFTLIFVLIERPQEALFGLALIAIGLALYLVSKRSNSSHRTD